LSDLFRQHRPRRTSRRLVDILAKTATRTVAAHYRQILGGVLGSLSAVTARASRAVGGRSARGAFNS
jgi:hypothetical protein